jgi:hypothetical protein
MAERGARWRWLRPAALLLLLAPLVAEVVASSNTPAVLFPVVLPLLVLVYGLPVLLARELWARRGLGALAFLVIALGYTAFNEGVVAATWFKLDPETSKVLVFTAEEVGRTGGVNWALVSGLTTYHGLWSVALPIALVELWLGERPERGRPWLPRWAIALSTAVVAFVAVGSLSAESTERVCEAATREGFAACADGRRWALVVVAAAAVLALALAHRPAGRRRAARRPADAALVWIGAGFATAFFLVHFVLPLAGQPEAAVVSGIVLLISAVAAVSRWRTAATWDDHAAVRLLTGALIPGMLSSLNAIVVLQPIAVGLFAWFFLRPLHQRTAAARTAGARGGASPQVRPWTGYSSS